MLIKNLEKFLKELEDEEVHVYFDIRNSTIEEMAIVRKNEKMIIIKPRVFMTGRNYLELKIDG